MPWLAMFLSATFTYASLGALAQRDLSLPSGGNVRASVILLVATALGASWKPVWALDILIGLYVPIYLFAALGWLGNAILPYLMLAFAMTLVVKRAVRNITEIFPVHQPSGALPGTLLIALLAVLSFAQWFRSTDMRDSSNRLCDITALCLLLWELPKWDEGSLRETAQAFVLGVTGSSLVLLNAELFKVDRLGKLLHFNPDFLGYVAGAALLIALSRMVFRASRWIPSLLFPILATALYFSGCRAAFYAALATIPLVLWHERRLLGLFTVGSFGAIGAYVIFQGINDPTGLAFRMTAPFMERFADASSRRNQIWSLLWEQRERYWLTGIGLDNGPQLTGGAGLFANGFALATHNVFFTFFVELGIAGLALFLAWQCWILWFGIKYRSRMALLLPIAVYFSVEGFFSGFNNISIIAFMLAVGFRLETRAHITNKIRPQIAYSRGRTRTSLAARVAEFRSELSQS